jgi:AAA15 family ATPase/GTPase/DNA-binding HxlR family transcriptional regulator
MENRSKYISRHINRFLLDPNNYRFVDREEYHVVDEKDVADPRVQMRTYNLLVGRNNENIQDLIISFKSNGILLLDPVQVKQAGDSLLTIEGNRRIATLKYLYEQFKVGNDVGKLTEDSFKKVEAVLALNESPVQHLVTMGLHHISGKKKWSPVNQAQLIFDLKNRYEITENEICNSLSITKHTLKRSLRTLALIGRYKKSDFGDQFESSKYSIFEEIIKNVEMKNWLNWDDDLMSPANKINEEKLFSWISKIDEIDRVEEGEEQTISKDPIVTKSHDIRELSKFINDHKALERMEVSRSITEGFSWSDAVGEARLRNSIENINKEVQTAFQFSEYMGDDDFTRIAKLRDKLDKLIPTNKAVFEVTEKESTEFFQKIQNQFSELKIVKYRKLSNINIKNLSRVNIFAGGNNMGKTSILEAFYVLTQLNNVNSLLDLERYRGRFYNEFHTKWIDKNFSNNIELEGCFNNTQVSVLIGKFQTQDNIEKSQYLSSISWECLVNNEEYSSNVNLFANTDPELYFQRSSILCTSAFTSPYRYDGKLLKKAHAKAVQEKEFDEIVDFIRTHLDKSIENIEMANIEGESRFLVTSSKLDEAIDITKYGEGLQRVFEIALLLGYCRNGILCIDEIDSAVHKSLLLTFTKFIQQLAEKFNVQVFLSTHSKECIDAFIENDYKNDEITAYALTENNGEIACKFIDGKRLEKLIDSINFDLR